MGSRSSSKSSSRSKGRPRKYSWKPYASGEPWVPLRVSWRRLSKQSPWLKQLARHQKRGARAISSIDGYAALYEQRTGKTWVTGAVLEAERDVCHDVLLVGPLTNLSSTWEKFLNEKLPWYSVHLDFDSYYDQRAYDRVRTEAFNEPVKHRILLLNYEAVTPLIPKLTKLHWDRVVYDEAQRLKNRASQSSRDAEKVARKAARRLALTGTPVDSNPRDLWAIMRFVAPEVLGTTWKDFEEEYLEKPNIDLSKPMRMIQRKKMELAYAIAKRKAPIREDKVQEVADLVSPHVGRITKEEAGIERARVRKLKFKLDPYEEKTYRKLEKKMVVKVNGEVIKTPLKITNIGKLQQITGGYIKDEDGEVHSIGTSKRRRLRRAIKKHTTPGEPFVIFCKYVWEVHALAKMMERMGYGRVARLWGKVKDMKRDKRRTNMLLAFQRGEFDVMVCQQRTGGVGVDLYRARKFFVYSMGHSFIDYDQMLSRGDFMFQESRADFFLLLADLTIDTDICFSVEQKKSITNAFYDRLS